MASMRCWRSITASSASPRVPRRGVRLAQFRTIISGQWPAPINNLAARAANRCLFVGAAPQYREKSMATIDLKSLVGRLNEPCRRALEAAAGLTLSRTHYNVEIEHWLTKLIDIADGDLLAILRHYEVDEARLRADLNRAMDRMKTGNARAPSLSPEIVECAK